jgi:hypothetical protein
MDTMIITLMANLTILSTLRGKRTMISHVMLTIRQSLVMAALLELLPPTTGPPLPRRLHTEAAMTTFPLPDSPFTTQDMELTLLTPAHLQDREFHIRHLTLHLLAGISLIKAVHLVDNIIIAMAAAGGRGNK